MKLLSDYFTLQKQIFDYFGYKEDWKVIPLDDRTDQYWMVILDERGGGSYCHHEEPLTKESVEAGVIYGGSIYTQRFLPKWVYRGAEYTMVCADTHTDGNKFLMIFDNTKECTDPEIKKLYVDFWR